MGRRPCAGLTKLAVPEQEDVEAEDKELGGVHRVGETGVADAAEERQEKHRACDEDAEDGMMEDPAILPASRITS